MLRLASNWSHSRARGQARLLGLWGCAHIWYIYRIRIKFDEFCISEPNKSIISRHLRSISTKFLLRPISAFKMLYFDVRIYIIGDIAGSVEWPEKFRKFQNFEFLKDCEIFSEFQPDFHEYPMKIVGVSLGQYWKYDIGDSRGRFEKFEISKIRLFSAPTTWLLLRKYLQNDFNILRAEILRFRSPNMFRSGQVRQEWPENFEKKFRKFKNFTATSRRHLQTVPNWTQNTQNWIARLLSPGWPGNCASTWRGRSKKTEIFEIQKF